MEQNTLINASINLTELSEYIKNNPEKVVVSKDTGRKYINLTISPRKETDKYGNDINISMARSKEDKENAVAVSYVGSGKTVSFESSMREATSEDISDLAF